MSATLRRLRWVLPFVVGIHLLVIWHFAPRIRARFGETHSETAVEQRVQEEVIELAPPPVAPPPRGKGLMLSTSLSSGPTERAVQPLPEGFFPKPAGLALGAMQLSEHLANAPRSGAQIVASLVPSALQAPSVARARRLAQEARALARPAPPPLRALPAVQPSAAQPSTSTAVASATKAPKITKAPLPLPVPTPTPEPLPEYAPGTLEAPPEEPAFESAPPAPIPFSLPKEDPAIAAQRMEAAIAEASRSAEQSAREAHAASRSSAPDYRALLSQGSVLPPDSPPPRSPQPLGAAPIAPAGDPGAYSAAERAQAAADNARLANVSRQQFFAELTARLKAVNQVVLAEAIKAGPRSLIRMKFALDRNGRVLSMAPAEPTAPDLLERAEAVIRKAQPLPRIPDALRQETLELSFPVEVYR
jgi:hypothetical protein